MQSEPIRLRIVVLFTIGIVVGVVSAPYLEAGTPDQLLRGEAPVLFTGAEGEDADDTLLLDGQPIRGDEIWLWVPALDLGGQVDLSATGQFFRIWDSGPVLGPNGNDDDRNGMRGMDFDPITSTFLISYEDSTTTGFTFGNILDGDLMELSVTAVTDGAITGFTWTRLFSECTNGSPGCIGEGDLNALMRAGDGTIYFGSGASQSIGIDGGGLLAVGSSTLIHATLTPDPRNIGPVAFLEPTVLGCPIPFCPGIYTGQIRGFDLLDSGEITFGTSGDFQNQDPSGNGIVPVGAKADIFALPDYFSGVTLLQQRTAELLYPGSLFFASPNIGDSEMLAHDILDTAMELTALIALIGTDSPAGLALQPFVGGVVDPFVRGDCNDDGMQNIADAIFLLAVLFPTGPSVAPVCDDACDGNDDGGVNIADAISILASLFGAPTIPLPDPQVCGADPTPGDLLDCVDSVQCP